MRVTVLGGCGAWPAAGQACSGYLVEHGGFRLLVDPGYATLPRLLERVAADAVDAVLVATATGTTAPTWSWSWADADTGRRGVGC